MKYFIKPEDLNSEISGNNKIDNILGKANSGDEIIFLPGSFLINRTIKISKKFSEENPLVISVAKPEKTVFTGSIALSKQDFLISSEDVLARLSNQSIKGNLLQINLSKYKIHDTGELTRYGYHLNDTKAQAELYIDNKKQTLVRWPKEGYVQFENILDPGPDINSEDFNNSGGKVSYSFNLPELIGNENDVWLDGILGFDWEHTHNKISKFDTARRTFILKHGEVSKIQLVTEYKQGKPVLQNRYYFENVFCELSLPGEYYIDRKTNVLYLIKPENWEEISDINMTACFEPVFNFSDSENAIIEGCKINISGDSGIVGNNCKNIRIRNCNISNISGNGIVFEGDNIEIKNCDINNIGGSGIKISGGEYKYLTGGRNVVDNCKIHNIGHRYRTYHPAISITGVGHRICNNTIFNTPHMAIAFSGNNHMIELNEFYNCINEFRDMGAIYNADQAGCHRRGTIIRRNYFHHIGNDGEYKKMGAIYPDWCVMGIKIIENIFQEIGTPNTEFSTTIFNNGGSYIEVENNLFIDCPKPYQLSFWLNGWGKDYVEGLKSKWEKVFDENNFEIQPHFKLYPELINFWEEDRVLPDTNTFSNNYFYYHKNSPEFSAPTYSDILYGDKSLLKSKGNKMLEYKQIKLDTKLKYDIEDIINAFENHVEFDIGRLITLKNK